MKISTIGCGLAMAAMLSGCANITTLSRHTNLPGGGEAIHLDAQQRVVIAKAPIYQVDANLNPVKDATGQSIVIEQGSVCAEPSPDALQAVSASLGLGAAAPSQGTASLSQALQQSTASIGLRTQSITMMRDAMYRVCEAYQNGAITKADVLQLTQRSQDVMLGVLAIEQLTGAVVARQVILKGGANATATANVNNTKAQLEAAQKAKNAADASVTIATSKLSSDTDILKPLQEQKDAGTLKTEQQPAYDKAAQSVKDDTQALTDAQSRAGDAARALAAIDQNFNAAVAGASATATGDGSFEAPLSGGSPPNANQAASVGANVQAIVATIVSKGRLTDFCIGLLQDRTAPPNNLAAQCQSIINADIELGKIYAQAYVEAIKSGKVDLASALAGANQSFMASKAGGAASSFMRISQ